MPKVRAWVTDENGVTKIYKTILPGGKVIDHVSKEEFAEVKEKIAKKAKRAFEEVLR